MKYIAIGQMNGGVIDLDWKDNQKHPTQVTIVTLVELLRNLAARNPHGVVRALVKDMNDQGSHTVGSIGSIQTDAVGNVQFNEVSLSEWLRPTAAADDLPKPLASPHPPATEVAGEYPQSETNGLFNQNQLFTQTFSTTRSVQSALVEKTIAVANTKGGAAKTTVAIVVVQAAAEMLPTQNVALIDINPSGNLAEHTIQATTATINDFAKDCERSTEVSVKALNHYVNWQPQGWFTINSPISIVTGEGGLVTDLSSSDISNISEALRPHSPVLVWDTGNNAKDPSWQAAMKRADTILVPVQWDPDTVVEAQKMLIDMDKVGHQDLKQRVIFVGTHSPRNRPDRKRARSYRQALQSSGWKVMDLPPDAHIAKKNIIEWEKLARKTKTAAKNIVEVMLR